MSQADGISLATDRRTVWRLAFLGLAGSLVGNGLARFAYTPLVPVLVEEGWLTTAEAGYLGAFNYAGYFAGALVGLWIGRRMKIGHAAVSSLALCVLSLFMVAIDWGFWWMVPWRFLAGCGAGVVMVLVPPSILRQLPSERWGFATGGVFAGIGLGIAISGILIPQLALLGAAASWLGLAIGSLVLTLAMHLMWREPPPIQPRPMAGTQSPSLPSALLCAAYGLYAVAIAAYSIFWVDFLARDLGLGLAEGGFHWTVLGTCALGAPLLAGWLAARHGFGPMLSLLMAATGIGALLPVFSDSGPLLYVSSILGGVLFVGVVTLFSGRTAELAGREGQQRLWWIMTLLFAIGQSGGSWGLSALYDATLAYRPLFAIAGAALLTGAILTLPPLTRALSRPRPPRPAE
ncbi:MAG: YbfB/YjiJ family MFS transporter [Alphaproteobacteria bacterium]|nr:YbfB/YjiJ family MFS transporter [Alphaproteobacteria bacterium]